jgi:hypothetical protein
MQQRWQRGHLEEDRKGTADVLGETVLQGRADRLIEIGRCHGKEVNVEKIR